MSLLYARKRATYFCAGLMLLSVNWLFNSPFFVFLPPKKTKQKNRWGSAKRVIIFVAEPHLIVTLLHPKPARALYFFCTSKLVLRRIRNTRLSFGGFFQTKIFCPVLRDYGALSVLLKRRCIKKRRITMMRPQSLVLGSALLYFKVDGNVLRFRNHNDPN